MRLRRCADLIMRLPWWCHQMETFSALLALCAGIHRSPVISTYRGQWRGVLIVFSAPGQTIDTPLGSLWRYCNVFDAYYLCSASNLLRLYCTFPASCFKLQGILSYRHSFSYAEPHISGHSPGWNYTQQIMLVIFSIVAEKKTILIDDHLFITA